MAATQADRDFVLKMVDDPKMAKNNTAGMASTTFFPMIVGEALRELVAEGVLELVEIAKPRMTYTYVRRTTVS